jgi:hypothetical protein
MESVQDVEQFGPFLRDENPEPWERPAAAASQPAALNTETLSTFESLTQACWKLTNSGEPSIAQMTLASFLPTLKQLAPSQKITCPHTSSYQIAIIVLSYRTLWSTAHQQSRPLDGKRWAALLN